MLPVQFRKELGLTADSELIIRVEDGGLRVETREAALRRMQNYLKQYKQPGESVVDEFLAERREEARKD
jgi:bifunctional DNA-binding transcriptional regulator/antitoxin component of YhaV-PrlF toxin-antitoxin module